MDEELITLRVQYLVDTDPFSSLSIYPVPSRAPVYSFVISTPLATQLGALLRFIAAPQRVRFVLIKKIFSLERFLFDKLNENFVYLRSVNKF
jgi:Formin N-terminal GTPase-binding domain